MQVSELIERLKKYPAGLEVLIEQNTDNGRTVFSKEVWGLAEYEPKGEDIFCLIYLPPLLNHPDDED